MTKFTLSCSVVVSMALAGCQLEEGTSKFIDDNTDTVNRSYNLMYSVRADRASGADLQNAALHNEGSYYVYLTSNETALGVVQFYVNNELMNADSSYPYDLNGGNNVAANVQSMDWFNPGENTVLVRVDGEVVTTSRFVVESQESSPEPTPEPTPEPEPTPDPEPDPTPEPEPTPDPEPDPTPEPEPTPEPVSYSLDYSLDASRADGQPVDGLTLQEGETYYLSLTTSDTDVGRVEFYVNDVRFSEENLYPYDFAGGTDSAANALPLSELQEGSNTLTTRVNGTVVAHSTVTLALSNPEPEPDTLSVTLYWSVPLERVNGDPLSLEEIGGYEIRYRETGTDEFVTLVIDDATIDQYLIEDLPGADYEFQVATFDSNGIYSDFVTAQ